jgi:hypothetical protein
MEGCGIANRGARERSGTLGGPGQSRVFNGVRASVFRTELNGCPARIGRPVQWAKARSARHGFPDFLPRVKRVAFFA